MATSASRAARAAVKELSLLADGAARPDAGIVILIYHRVGSSGGGEMNVSATAFHDQMQYLRDTQRVLSLDQALVELAGAQPVRAGVVVTFDDGTADWVDHALPVLAEHSIPATFYVATRFVDEGESFPHDGHPISWAGLAELRDSGLATIGSHTHGHTLLDRLDPALADDELRRCDELLEDKLGVVPRHFCYPKALAPSEACERLVVARYDSAVLAGTKANTASVDLHRLARSPIQGSDRMRHVKAKVRGGMGTEDRLRERINRRRYRAATN